MLKTPDHRLADLDYERGRVRAHYDRVAAETFWALRRNLPLVFRVTVVGTLLAVLLVLSIKPHYTADAMVRPDLSRPAGPSSDEGGASIEATLLVEGEARRIRTLSMARRVADRLKLQDNPKYTSRSLLSRFSNLFNSIDPLDIAATVLSGQIDVTHDTESYVINISATSSSAGWAATLANAYAFEYVASSRLDQLKHQEFAARNTLQRIERDLGALHPDVQRARLEVETAEERVGDFQTLVDEQSEALVYEGYSVLRAIPSTLPAGPNRKAIMIASVIASLVAAAAFVIVKDRQNRSVRTEFEAVVATDARCLGVVPRLSDSAGHAVQEAHREALRGLIVSAGLSFQPGELSVLMVTAPLGDPVSGRLAEELASHLKEGGVPVLLLDLVSEKLDVDDGQASTRPEPYRRTGPGTELFKIEGQPNASALTDASLGRLIERARSAFDVMILHVPPVLVSADAILVGRRANLSLLVAAWNRTPLENLGEAAHLLRSHDVTLDGVVLADVVLDRYASFGSSDRASVIGKTLKT